MIRGLMVFDLIGIHLKIGPAQKGNYTVFQPSIFELFVSGRVKRDTNRLCSMFML